VSHLITLDLATKTGFAIAEIPAAPLPTSLEIAGGAETPVVKSGAVVFGSPGCEIGVFMHAAHRWLDRVLTDHPITCCIFEAPIMPKMTQLNTLRKLYGLAALVEMMCVEHDLLVYEANASTVYKHFGVKGKGKERKKAAVAACMGYGWRPESDDEADALMIWHYGVSVLQRRGKRHES
jgi:Holliday junction resolvasome RuvABC endonuclease subunit